MARIFIDGAGGTVGREIQAYLPELQRLVPDVALIQLPEHQRRDINRRQDAMAAADIILLCLPDDVARATMPLIQAANPGAKVLDASAAHRCQPDWVYGLSEITPRTELQAAYRIANPGCFATACILAARPLAQAGCLPTVVDYHGYAGYSAAGKNWHGGDFTAVQIGKSHRHIAEISAYTGSEARLVVNVGSWHRGLMVCLTVPEPCGQVLDYYRQAYERNVRVQVIEAAAQGRRVNVGAVNHTQNAQILVGGEGPHSVIYCVIDNLGKGSAGTAVENLATMLGVAP